MLNDIISAKDNIVFKRNKKRISFECKIVCFTSYFVFSCIAVLPHSPGVVYYHLLLRRETRIPGVAPFSFRIGIWDLFVHRGQKSYTPTAFGKLWTTPGVRCMQHASSEDGEKKGGVLDSWLDVRKREGGHSDAYCVQREVGGGV